MESATHRDTSHFGIIGGTGFIGRRLCRRIVEGGGRVTALVRRTSARELIQQPGVQLVNGDLVTGQGLDEVVKNVDYVIHLGGLVKSPTVDGFWNCNVDGTRHLLKSLTARSSPPPFVYCSSLTAMGPSVPGRPRSEGDLPAPVSHYGRSKLAAEQAAREQAAHIPTTIVRPPVVYGPDDPAFLPSVLPMIRAGLVLKAGFGHREYSLIHVDDLCTALLMAAQRGRRLHRARRDDGVYTVCDGEVHSWESMAAAVSEALGRRRPPRLVPVPLGVVAAAAAGAELVGGLFGRHPFLNRDKARELRGASWTCSMQRARDELGFTPSVQLKQGLTSLLDVGARLR